MSGDPPQKKAKVNEEAVPDDDNEQQPDPLFARSIGDGIDPIVSHQEDVPFEQLEELSSFLQETFSSQSLGLAASFEDIKQFQQIIIAAYYDHFKGFALHASTNFAKLRSMLPDASEVLAEVIRHFIDLTERRDSRHRVVIPIESSPDPWNAPPNQSTTAVANQGPGKKRGDYKCWKCGAKMKGHKYACNLPLNGPGLFTGHDGRMWNIRFTKDVIKEMNDAAKENGAVTPDVEKQCGKKPKKREKYRCDFCKNHKRSKFHKKYCIHQPGSHITLGSDGLTSFHATPAGRANKSKSGVKDRGDKEVRSGLEDFVVLDKEEDDDAEDDRKPAAIDTDKKSDGDGGKGDDKDDSNDNANGDGDGGVARHAV